MRSWSRNNNNNSRRTTYAIVVFAFSISPLYIYFSRRSFDSLKQPNPLQSPTSGDKHLVYVIWMRWDSLSLRWFANFFSLKPKWGRPTLENLKTGFAYVGYLRRGSRAITAAVARLKVSSKTSQMLAFLLSSLLRLQVRLLQMQQFIYNAFYFLFYFFFGFELGLGLTPV